MPLRKILHLLFPLASLTCLAVAFAQSRQYLALAALLLPLLAWLSAFIWPHRWLPLTALLLSVLLAGLGLFQGAASVLMLLSALLALAGWDLLLWAHALPADLSTAALSRLAYSHYKSLALATLVGLLAALAGRLLRLQLPFGVVFILALLALVSLERLWHALGD
jgi:hypothetical protein